MSPKIIDRRIIKCGWFRDIFNSGSLIGYTTDQPFSNIRVTNEKTLLKTHNTRP